MVSRMGHTPLPLRVTRGVVCGVVLGDRLGFPTTTTSIKEEPIMVAVFHLWCLNGERPGTPPGNGGRSKRHLDRRGSIGTVRVSTRLGFGKILRSLLSWQIYDHIHKTKRKWNEFSFNLIYVINQAKNRFVFLRVILKILEDLIRPHTLKINSALRGFLASASTTSRKSWRRPQSAEENQPR